MLTSLGIKNLYPLALAEGEGVGTAYEYYVKRNLLKPWLKNAQIPTDILIAGLPEKYGCSLDFILLGQELNAAITVVDDRPEPFEKLSATLKNENLAKLITAPSLNFHKLDDFVQLQEFNQKYDLILSSEVLQRLPQDLQTRYINQLVRLGRHLAVFTPNGDNPRHNDLSGLNGLQLEDLGRRLNKAIFNNGEDHLPKKVTSGYVDMPPFPPGITRTEDQREQASSGAFEAFVMWSLGYYAKSERFFPEKWKKGHAHIVYTLIDVF